MMEEAHRAHARAIEAGEGDWVETPSADEEQEVGALTHYRVFTGSQNNQIQGGR